MSKPTRWAVGLILVAFAVGCRSTTAIAPPSPAVPTAVLEDAQQLERRFDEWWTETHRSRIGEDVVLILPEPGKVYWGGGWLAQLKHSPSASSIALRRGFGELLMSPEGATTAPDATETLFGQRFEIGRTYLSEEGGKELEAALHDPTVMTRIMSSIDMMAVPVSREEAIHSAFEGFHGGAMKSQFTPVGEPREPLAILIAWSELKNFSGVQCEGYVIGPSRTATEPFKQPAHVWFVQFEGRSRTVASGYEFTWANVVIDAETGQVRAECRSNQPRRATPVRVTIMDEAESTVVPDPARIDDR